MLFRTLLIAALSCSFNVSCVVDATSDESASCGRICDKSKSLPELIQASTVCIINKDGSSGSGFIVRTEGNVAWCWTVNHVIRHAKKPDGTYDDIDILTPTGGKTTAQVIKAGPEIDIALLLIKAPSVVGPGLKFAASEPPIVGTPVYFCGATDGPHGVGTLTAGIISFIGRKFPKLPEVDQCSAPTMPGSSGGVVCLASNGKILGALKMGPGESFSCYVPTRLIRAWAEDNGVGYALGD